MNIDCLPPEIFSKILSFFTFDELLVLEHVSYYWRDRIHDSSIWNTREIIFEKNWGRFTKNPLQFFFLCFMKNVLSFSSVIKNLSIDGVNNDRDLTVILKNCSQLVKLKLTKCALETEGLRYIESMSNLKNLFLRDCRLVDDFDTEGTFAYSVSSNINFSLITNLKTIVLPDYGLSNKNFHNLLLCSKITHLNIDDIENISQKNIIKFLVQNKDILKTLRIYTRKYNDELLTHVAECKELKHLAFRDCHNFTDQGLLCLQKLELISFIISKNTIFSKEALQEILCCNNWSKLELLSITYVDNFSVEIINLLEQYRLMKQSKTNTIHK